MKINWTQVQEINDLHKCGIEITPKQYQYMLQAEKANPEKFFQIVKSTSETKLPVFIIIWIGLIVFTAFVLSCSSLEIPFILLMLACVCSILCQVQIFFTNDIGSASSKLVDAFKEHGKLITRQKPKTFNKKFNKKFFRELDKDSQNYQ